MWQAVGTDSSHVGVLPQSPHHTLLYSSPPVSLTNPPHLLHVSTLISQQRPSWALVCAPRGLWEAQLSSR